MVNANKHRALKIINELTQPEREARQEANKRKFYYKHLNCVCANSNWDKSQEAKEIQHILYNEGG